MVVRGSGGQAVVELVADSSQFKQETSRVTAGLNSEMSNLGTTVMGVVGALGLLAAAKGAVSLLTDLAKKAIETADSFEVMEKQLITLTKSEEKARGFFREIKDFAKETPYQVKDLAQSFNMLYPIFKDKTVPMMKLIGDTASGTGRSFEDTSSAMMRMATGDWGVEIMRQLFLVKSEFGDIFGPNGELVGSQEEAWAKLQEILGDRFGGMMVGMMDTVQGKVSNLKDVLDSLAASVGAELTPITKEVLDILIDVVKQAEESGELRDAARGLADAFRENKDELTEVLGLLPDMIDLFTVMVDSAATLLKTVSSLNQGWAELWGPGNQTLVGDMADVVKEVYQQMKYTLTTAQRLGRVIGLAAQGKISEAWDAAGQPMPGAPGEGPTVESGRGIEGRIKDYLEAGGTPEGAEAWARSMGATEAQIQFGWDYYRRAKGETPSRPGKPGKAPKKGKEYLGPMGTTYELDVYKKQSDARARMDLAEDERAAKRDAEREEELKKQEDELRQLAEKYAEYLDPTSYIIQGFKSGEMKKAIQDFAVDLGTRVSQELMRKLIVMGFMAILSMITGGGVQGARAMGRGGVIKAASGLLGVLPSRPGGWYLPFGNQLLNVAEAGQAEAIGVFPPGRRGQEIITGPLARMFDIPVINANPTVMVHPSVTAPPVNVGGAQVNVQVRNMDRHHIAASVAAERGQVNKSVTVRQ